jgi:hypothetical protein
MPATMMQLTTIILMRFNSVLRSGLASLRLLSFDEGLNRVSRLVARQSYTIAGMFRAEKAYFCTGQARSKRKFGKEGFLLACGDQKLPPAQPDHNDRV